MRARDVDPRVRFGRHAERGHHDRATIDAILDEGFVCHLGFVVDGAPTVVPTSYGREGDTLYVHGSVASRAMASPEVDVCLTVTLVDGLVLARSAFHHSVNYRSVVVLGTARRVEGPDDRRRALRVITEHVAPGRWDESRPPTARELAATAVLALSLDVASAKVRDHGVVDDREDLSLPHWAGVLPLGLAVGVPQPADDLGPDVPVPAHVVGWPERLRSRGDDPATSNAR